MLTHAHCIKQIRKCPQFYWIKCNTNGISKGNPSLATYKIVFRDSLDTYLEAFTSNVDIASSFKDELTSIVMAIIYTFKRALNQLWLKNILSFPNNHSLKLPWSLENCYPNEKNIFIPLGFKVSHIYRERNNFVNIDFTFKL